MSGPVLSVRGVLVGRFPVNGHPGDTPEMVASMVAAFKPSTVPIVNEHGGPFLGWLDTLAPWDAVACDLAFTGTITEADDALRWRLLAGVYASSEMFSPSLVVNEDRGVRVSRTYYRGDRCEGWTLTGVAIVVRPASRGSWMQAI